MIFHYAHHWLDFEGSKYYLELNYRQLVCMDSAINTRLRKWLQVI